VGCSPGHPLASTRLAAQGPVVRCYSHCRCYCLPNQTRQRACLATQNVRTCIQRAVSVVVVQSTKVPRANNRGKKMRKAKTLQEYKEWTERERSLKKIDPYQFVRSGFQQTTDSFEKARVCTSWHCRDFCVAATAAAAP
jgi:hypothetical protein